MFFRSRILLILIIIWTPAWSIIYEIPGLTAETFKLLLPSLKKISPSDSLLLDYKQKEDIKIFCLVTHEDKTKTYIAVERQCDIDKVKREPCKKKWFVLKDKMIIHIPSPNPERILIASFKGKLRIFSPQTLHKVVSKL